ncbi:lipoxygenase homology domain-containing protein 1-like, partial [Saccoglossus kowalevskii]
LKLPTDIGRPYKLRLRHDNSGKKADWYVDKVILEKENFTLDFLIDGWLSNKKGNKVIITEVASTESRLEVLRYDIAVKTGKERNAGTDANCWVKIFGERGDTGQRWLSNNIYLNRRIDKFEKGKTDKFKIHAVDLGKITDVVVGHDSKKKSEFS